MSPLSSISQCCIWNHHYQVLENACDKYDYWCGIITLLWHYAVGCLLTLVFDKECNTPSSSSLVFWGWNMGWDGLNQHAYWMQQDFLTQIAHLLIVEASRHPKLIINNFVKLANFLPNLASKTAARMLILAHFSPKLSDFEAKSSKTGWRFNNIESVKILLHGSTNELHMRIFL